MLRLATIPLGRRSTRRSSANAVLAAIMVAVVGIMVVPLPTWALDLLLAANLAASLSILLLSLYVSDALKIAGFPTLLLLTTLVRLGLNVASTRLILLQADAGQVIRAFGHFVVRGNYVVGGVIFVILTLIQFVVIAKGSERVAEVGARFTLDAMPGKQMAIDAELRSGAIDGAEATRRRRQLSRESHFYGAMDGAMKFVKGDVIASFLITLINLFGGLAIGIVQRDMTAAAALKRYGLLTIGDGLVTQIPALVLATAAGILVTRVANDDDPDAALGEQLTTQLLGEPRALRASGLFIVGLALVPGLPAAPFLVIGALLVTASAVRSRALEPRRAQSPTERAEARAFAPLVTPWSLTVSRDLGKLLEDTLRSGNMSRPGLPSAAWAIREGLFQELGVPLPAAALNVSRELPARHCLVTLHEIPAGMVAVPGDTAEEHVAALIVESALPIFRERAAEFLGVCETQLLLDQLELVAPATVRHLVPKPVAPTLLADVLRRLVEEHVSVRDLKSILEAVAQVANHDKDAPSVAEHVRSQLRRAITHELTGGRPELDVYLLDSRIEETVRSAVSKTSAGSFLTLAPATGRDIVVAVKSVLNTTSLSAARPVLLTAPDTRRFVKKLIEADLPLVRVVSFTELLPEVVVRPLGKAAIAP